MLAERVPDIKIPIIYIGINITYIFFLNDLYRQNGNRMDSNSPSSSPPVKIVDARVNLPSL
jgi:hypothetical protein